MWKNLSKKLEWLLIVVVMGGTVMLGGCGGSSDPHTPYVYCPDKVVVQSGPVSVTARLKNSVGSNVVQAEFTVVSYTSSVAPQITGAVQDPITLETSATINIIEPGTYAIKANIGSLEETFTIIVLSNFDAGSAQTVTLGSTVTLTGTTSPTLPTGFTTWWSASDYIDFDLLGEYYFGVVYRTNIPELPTVQHTFTPTNTGERVFGFCVVASLINSDYPDVVCDTVTITVVDPTTPPVADAGSARTVAVGDAVSLSGSASSDTYSLPLTYSWSITSMPVGSAASLINATTVNPSFTADVAGNYVIGLTVNNGHLSSTAAAVTITASPSVLPNTAPVANAGPDQNVTAGNLVTLDGSACSDADGNTITYAWGIISAPSGSSAVLNNDTSVSPTFTPDLVGDYVIDLDVYDGITWSQIDTVTVTVAAAATSGSITTIAALENTLTNNTFLVAHSSATDGLLELYEFGAPGSGGSLFFAYISPMSVPFSHTREWSVTDTGTYIQASETYPFFALNSAAPVNDTGVLIMTGYAGTNTNLGGSSVASWIKVATVSTADFTGKTVKLDINQTNQYVFSTTTTGQYTDGFGNTQSFTWGIDSGGHKAVVTLNTGMTRSLYLTVRGASGSALREMGVVSASSDGTITGGSLQNWIWQ